MLASCMNTELISSISSHWACSTSISFCHTFMYVCAMSLYIYSMMRVTAVHVWHSMKALSWCVTYPQRWVAKHGRWRVCPAKSTTSTWMRLFETICIHLINTGKLQMKNTLRSSAHPEIMFYPLVVTPLVRLQNIPPQHSTVTAPACFEQTVTLYDGLTLCDIYIQFR